MEMLTHGYWRDQTRIEEAARARPWRLTMSMDGVGQAHSVVRGRDDFWEKSSHAVATLIRLRKEERLGYAIRLKTVIMQQNLDDVCNVARFAAENGVEVLYQPIEQNYDTPEDVQLVQTFGQLAARSGKGRCRRPAVDRAEAPGAADLQFVLRAGNDGPLLPRSGGAPTRRAVARGARRPAPVLRLDYDATGAQRRRGHVLPNAARGQHQDDPDPRDLAKPPAVVGRGLLPLADGFTDGE